MSAEIVAAALRWHRAHHHRLVATAESNRFKADQKRATGFGGADCELSRRVTQAKRRELVALRALSKACATLDGQAQDVGEDVLLLEA